jgi:hypothetical protein
MKYIVVHCKHEGCYEYKSVEDIARQTRMTSIRINPPKLFVFDDKESAGEFFEEYMNDVDCIDIKCRKGEDVEHADYCTCGIVELNEDGYPILFYNKIHQIFLTEIGCNVFEPLRELKHDICNMNLTNKLIRKCRKLTKEQRDQYIELGRVCQECDKPDFSFPDPDSLEHSAPTPPAVPSPAVPSPVVPSPVVPSPAVPLPTPIVASQDAPAKKPRKAYVKKSDKTPKTD